MDPASTSSSSIGETTKNMATSTTSGGGIWSAIQSQYPTIRQHKHLLYLIGGGLGIGLTGLGLYMLWKKGRPEVISGSGSASAHRQKQAQQKRDHPIFVKAEDQKAMGIEAFKNRRYEEAIDFFTKTIQILQEVPEKLQISENDKWRELLASCENNIAACYAAMNDLNSSIEHCNIAIMLKPQYTKPLVRRAKCYQVLGRNYEALEDYLDLISMENDGAALNQQQMINWQNELDKAAEAIIAPECQTLINNPGRSGQPKKIPQTVVAPWQFNLTVNDPLLARANAINEKTAENCQGLDKALLALKRSKYDEIATIAAAVANDDNQDILERAQAVLLAARFLFYQSLAEQAKSMARRFNDFWEKLDESQKLANKDLHVAYIVLQMMLYSGQWQSFALESLDSPLTEAIKQHLTQMAEDALRINPKNVDPLLFLGHILMTADHSEDALNTFQRAKKLDKEHPFVRYYEIYAGYLVALRQEHMARIHNHIVEMEHALKNNDPPVFALIMMSKIGILMQNNELAVESLKRAVKQMPNNSYAIFLLGMMDSALTHENTPELFVQYLQQLERKMLKALEADPNNWEPHRMLAKMHMNRHNFAEAIRHFDQGLELARGKEELMVLLKERLIVRTVEQRKAHNKRLPKGMRML